MEVTNAMEEARAAEAGYSGYRANGHGAAAKHREKLGWGAEIWQHIDMAVYEEYKRVSIAGKILPTITVPETANTFVKDSIVLDGDKLRIDETKTAPIVEIMTQFLVSPQQIEQEAEMGTVKTLSTWAANYLTLAMDALIFQGPAALEHFSPFTTGLVKVLHGPAGPGLLDIPSGQIIEVAPIELRNGRSVYGENTFAAIADAYARLQSGEGLSQAHYYPYVSVVNHNIYADTCAPLPSTLIMPKDRIVGIMDGGFYGSGTIPAGQGFVLSLGGQNTELVISCLPTVEFVVEDNFRNFQFRVKARFGVKEKLTTNVIMLKFQQLGSASVKGK